VRSTLRLSHECPAAGEFSALVQKVADLRLVQCAFDGCRAVFYLCRGCDRGHVFCTDGRHNDERKARRSRSKRRHWRTRSARMTTARRVSKWRAHRKNETDMGSREVGPTPKLPLTERSVATPATELRPEKAAHETDPDRKQTTHGEPSSPTRTDATSPQSKRNSAETGTRDTLRCALCGINATLVRLETLARSRPGRTTKAATPSLSASGRGPPRTKAQSRLL
jgi:hypothetical protein